MGNVPKTHEDGRTKNAHGQALKDSVNAEKRAAALKNPYRDVNQENRAKAKDWTDGSVSNIHTPRQ